MSERVFTDLEKAILQEIQTAFPISSDPYGDLASKAGCDRETAHRTVQELRYDGIIRRLGGIFDGSRLGYVGCLVAAQVDSARIEEAAARAAAYPEVTHNYERDDDYNLWFTIVAGSEARREQILDDVRSCKGVRSVAALPATKTFKIKVDFNFTDSPRQPPAVSHEHSTMERQPLTIGHSDKKLIRRACGDLGNSLNPFAELAVELGMDESDVVARLNAYRNAGILRRFGAVLRHQRAGFSANGMSAWDVPDADVDAVGEKLAACPEVTHCYERPRMPDWDFNIYGMIHGRNDGECLAVAERISQETGITGYRVLFSKREFKKSSMVYFAEEHGA